MSESKHFVIINSAVLHNTNTFLSNAWLRYKQENTPLEVLIRPKAQTRSSLQNALLHAVLTDISKQVKWHGQKWDMEVWKRLCMAAWLREKRESPKMIPALDGHGIDIIYERTSKLSVKDCADFCQWCLAFGDENGVIFKVRDL